MQPNKYRVRYVGEDAAEVCKGEIYQAKDLRDGKTMIGVLDRSGEGYAYPKIFALNAFSLIAPRPSFIRMLKAFL
ncbi:MAG: hypothetical protein IKJ99_04850 [Oscillospiraceae bacterium]|nr:hypothetical protein [Oscillospiraceae bacterium]